MDKQIHQGRNIKRFREMLGIKQERLAADLGEDWTQKKISLLEQKDVVDDQVLNQVAGLLKVPVDAIKNFDEDSVVQIISNTFHDSSILNGINYNPTFNPIDRWAAAIDANKILYEQLLIEKDEKIALLKQLLDRK